MTVTDELLAELEDAASNATPGPWSYDGSYVCTMRQDGETVYVESWNPVADALLSKNVKYISAANPSTITALTAELRRLRAENAELEQSLAESRANDQAAMGWLTSLRWASGDRGERMLPELVTHIEGLAKDSGRLDLLDSLCEAYGFQDIHEGNRWVIDGPFRDIRAAADSLEAQ